MSPEEQQTDRSRLRWLIAMNRSTNAKGVLLLIAAVVTAAQGFYDLAVLTAIYGVGLLGWSWRRRNRSQTRATESAP
jgi:hypothetical protein